MSSSQCHRADEFRNGASQILEIDYSQLDRMPSSFVCIEIKKQGEEGGGEGRGKDNLQMIRRCP